MLFVLYGAAHSSLSSDIWYSCSRPMSHCFNHTVLLIITVCQAVDLESQVDYSFQWSPGMVFCHWVSSLCLLMWSFLLFRIFCTASFEVAVSELFYIWSIPMLSWLCTHEVSHRWCFLALFNLLVLVFSIWPFCGYHYRKSIKDDIPG